MSKNLWFRVSMLALCLTGSLLFAGCNEPESPEKRLERETVPVVTKLLQRNDVRCECLKVSITKKIDDKNYEGTALLDNGNSVDIKIEILGDMVEVKITSFFKK